MPASISEIRETFTLNQNALPLTPKIISRTLLDYTRKYTPVRRFIPRQTWSTNRYLFNQRTGLVTAQGTTEAPPTTGAGSVVATSSTYNQVGFDIKHFQANLDISTFSAQIANVNGNVFDLELASAGRGMAFYEEMLHLYGTAGATNNSTRPQWDGFDILTSTTNKLDAGNQVLTIANLDSAIDQIKGLLAMELGDNYYFVMSPKMLSKLNSLFVQQTRYNSNMRIFSRDDYGIPDGAVADNTFDAGIEVQSYRGIPIVESSFISSVGAMSTVGAATSTATNQFPGSVAYYYVVEAVTTYGITTASVECSATPTSSQVVTLTWTTPTILDAFGNSIPVLSYRVFRGTSSGAETLYATVSAVNTVDGAVTSFVDTNIPTTPYATGSTALAATVAVSGNNAAPDGVTFPRIAVANQNVEDIFLLPRDPDFVLVPVVNEMNTVMLAPINARTRQFALTADLTLALRAPAFAAKICRVRSA